MLVIGRNNLSFDIIHLKSNNNNEKSDSTHTIHTVQLTGDSKDNIQQIYIDDSGHHVIITTYLNEVIYYSISKQQQVHVTKFTDRIECVSFCSGIESESQSEVKSHSSVSSILLGTNTGTAYLTLYHCVSYLNFLYQYVMYMLLCYTYVKGKIYELQLDVSRDKEILRRVVYKLPEPRPITRYYAITYLFFVFVHAFACM